MAFKQYDTLDEVPEAYRDDYKSVNSDGSGPFIPDFDGAGSSFEFVDKTKESSALKRTRGERDQARAEKRQLRSELDSLKGIIGDREPDAVKAALERAEKFNGVDDPKKIGDERVRAREAELKKEHDKALGTAEKRSGALSTFINERLISGELDRALLAAGIKPSALPVARSWAKSFVQVQEAADGEGNPTFSTRVLDANGEQLWADANSGVAMSIEQWAKDTLAKSEELAWAFPGTGNSGAGSNPVQPASGGSGGGGSGMSKPGVTTVNGKQVVQWSDVQAGRLPADVVDKVASGEIEAVGFEG